MSELYYPGFEISTLNWLKYSLLYKKELYTIVPDNVDNIYMSDVYNYVENETDLLKRYHPMYEEGEKTSREVIELLENILRYPERYFSVTNTLSSEILTNKWTSTQDYNIFRQKYSCSFESFILDNNLGRNVKKGIKVHKDIALIYMAALAENISNKYNYKLATDVKDYKNLNQLFQSLWDHNNNLESYKVSEMIIKQQIPKRIEDISIKEIIHLRNSRDYKQSMDSYNRTLNQFINGLDDIHSFGVQEYLDDIRVINKDLVAQISCMLGATIPATLTLVNNNTNDNILNNLIGAGTFLAATGSLMSIQPNVNQYAFRDRSKSKKFISKLGRLR